MNMSDLMQTINADRPAKNKRQARGKSKSKAPRTGKLTTGHYIRAGSFAVLAMAGLAVSLPHLAGEVALLTGAGAGASWFTAIVIDCGIVVNKAHLSAKGPKTIVSWCILSACTILSIVLNCHAFMGHANGTFGSVAAIGFGTFIPLFVLGMGYLASETMLGRKE